MLTLIEKKHEGVRRGRHRWVQWKGLYRCECGELAVVDNQKANRTTKSCGCLRRAANTARLKGKFGADHPNFGMRYDNGRSDEERRIAHNERKRRYREANRDKLASANLRRQYGITLEDYDRMFEEQDGTCAICDREPDEGIRLHVDHCHETGRVRGLLCRACNMGVGHFADDAERARRLVDYLTATDAS